MACDARLIEIASASAALCTCIIFHDTRRHDPGKIFFNCPAPGKNIHFVDRLFFVDGCERMADDIPSLSLPLAFPSRLFFPPSGGKHRPVDDAERSAVRGDTRFSSAMGCTRRSDDHLSTPLDSYRFLGDKLHYGIIEEGYSGRGGGKESNREMMFANRLTTAQRRFMLLGRFANREIGK